ncbi:MAG: hypothetical protein K2K95_13200, partial [Muribaculaceae bacterium]|nr:hypothetical protein [Muribaculaceae bacterium]
ARSVATNLRNKLKRDLGYILNIEITHRGPSGRADRLKLTGTKGNLEIGKELMIRRLLSPTHLYSSAITITRQPSPHKETESEIRITSPNSIMNNPDISLEFAIDGSGWGHGVGLCQIGAARMALEGHDFRSILSFYYPGASLST